MKKQVRILALNGSPNPARNTANLMRWVLEGCKKEGAFVKWVDLHESDINYCTGCHGCIRGDMCVIRDDVDSIMEDLQTFDGAVVGSPVYEGYPSAQMKTLMDRIALFTLYRGILDDKRTVGVSTSGVAPTKRTARECAMMFGRSSGLVMSKTASLTGGYGEIDERTHRKLKENAVRKGRKLVKDIRKPPVVSRSDLKYAWIGFLRKNFLKRLILKNPEEFAGVIEYWKDKGWLK
jgi:multimeric flavodoxin WrbA